MAGELQIATSLNGANIYAVIRDASGAVFNGSGLETYDSGNLPGYAIALLEQATSRYYVGDFPSIGAGYYHITIYQQAGGGPAETDALLNSYIIDWTGTTVSILSLQIANVLSLLPGALIDGFMASAVSEFSGATLSDLSDALLDHPNGVEAGYTLRQSLRLILSALTGQVAGAGTTTVTIKAADVSKTRITAVVDASGNRSSVTLDPT